MEDSLVELAGLEICLAEIGRREEIGLWQGV
jgi:hypothetical protein